MPLHQDGIESAVGGPACLHAPLRSFGPVEGGAAAVVQAFAVARCTLLAGRPWAKVISDVVIRGVAHGVGPEPASSQTKRAT